MAEVYAAADERLGRRVAVKILRAEYATDPAVVARFLNEARITARLAHPYILTVLDVGVETCSDSASGQGARPLQPDAPRTRPYLVLTLVEGPTLAEALVRAGGRLPLGQALDLAKQVAAGVAYAHCQGIVHCDLKPANILLTPEGTVKVADFGLARAVAGAGSAESRIFWGTPQYMAPEVLAGEPPTAAGDVYSLGIILHELLTGVPLPYYRAIDRAREMPGHLAEILRRACAPQPQQRYADAGEFLADLLRFEEATRAPTRQWMVEGIPGGIQAPPPAGQGRQHAGNYWSRLILVATAVAVAAAAMLAGGAWYEVNKSSRVPERAALPTATPTALPAVTSLPSSAITPGPTPIPTLEAPAGGRESAVQPPERRERPSDDDRPERSRGRGRTGRHR